MSEWDWCVLGHRLVIVIGEAGVPAGRTHSRGHRPVVLLRVTTAKASKCSDYSSGTASKALHVIQCVATCLE